MKKLLLAAVAALSFVAGAFAKSNEIVPAAVPGTFENAAPKKMKDVLALDSKLKIADDEFVIYYVRNDGDYKPWALWMWANPGGDGNASWPYTQNWKVQDGIGYMRFKLNGSTTGGTKFVSSDGVIGLIVRQKDDWIKDGNDDRLWNISVSNRACVFSGDGQTYAAIEYKPTVKNAELTALNQVKVTLSGGFALDVDGNVSGFKLVNSNGKEFKIASVVNADSADPAMNMAKNILINLAEEVSIGDALVVKNKSFLSDAKVNSTKVALKLAESTSPSLDEVLGCEFDGNTAVFKLWAPTSASCTLNLYSKSENKEKNVWKTLPLVKDEKTGVWSVTYTGSDIDGKFYDYTLVNAKGKVNVLDPYARSMACHNGKGGSGLAAVINLSSQKAGVQSASYYPLEKRDDAVIYEVSVRDFTISPDAGVKAMPGTYKAFIEKIPYLKELGITHIQLMPVMNFFFNDEANKAYENAGTVNSNNYNWGYDPHNYFTPEGWYATDASDPYCRVRELRELIDECHKAGLGVLLDVVYNHMAGPQFLDDIVPGYYFRTTETGGFKSNSGCGNDTASERKMMKKLIVDSTSYWVKNYKVDGFRFDLMGLMEATSVTDSYDACAKINPCTLFEGEGWKMYNGAAGTVGMDQNYMLKTNSVAVFNDEFRDTFKAGGFNETGRGFITKKPVSGEKLFREVTGNPVSNYHADEPGDNLNYLVCHDGLTLHDGIVNNLKLDEVKDRKEIVQRIKMGNFFVMTSQGLAFLHAGQERGRTKPNLKNSKNECIGNFVRNSYDSSDNINQIVWKLDSDYEGVLAYTKGLIGVRKAFDVFRMKDAKKIAKNFKLVNTGDDLVFAYTIKDGKSTWIVAVNAKTEKAKINAGVSVNSSVVYVDSNTADKNGIENPAGVTFKGKTVELEPLTAVVTKVN